MSPDTNGWSRSELYVMEELARLSAKLDAVDSNVTNLRVEVAQKGAIWGAISGAFVAFVGWVWQR